MALLSNATWPFSSLEAIGRSLSSESPGEYGRNSRIQTASAYPIFVANFSFYFFLWLAFFAWGLYVGNCEMYCIVDVVVVNVYRIACDFVKY